MRLTWPAGTRLRSFYDPDSHRLSIVSDVIDDEAEGRTYANRLAVTASTEGVLRDLELVPGPVTTATPEPLEVTPSREGTAIAVWVPEVQEITVEEHPPTTSFTVRLLPMAPEKWVQLGDSGIAIGLVDQDVLAVIRVEPEMDPAGYHEAEWLDSLNA